MALSTKLIVTGDTVSLNPDLPTSLCLPLLNSTPETHENREPWALEDAFYQLTLGLCAGVCAPHLPLSQPVSPASLMPVLAGLSDPYHCLLLTAHQISFIHAESPHLRPA